jgi:hypothetical protein
MERYAQLTQHKQRGVLVYDLSSDTDDDNDVAVAAARRFKDVQVG